MLRGEREKDRERGREKESVGARISRSARQALCISQQHFSPLHTSSSSSLVLSSNSIFNEINNQSNSKRLKEQINQVLPSLCLTVCLVASPNKALIALLLVYQFLICSPRSFSQLKHNPPPLSDYCFFWLPFCCSCHSLYNHQSCNDLLIKQLAD